MKNRKNNFPGCDLNLDNLDRQPTGYFCCHRGLCESEVLQSILFVNMIVAFVTSHCRLDSILESPIADISLIVFEIHRRRLDSHSAIFITTSWRKTIQLRLLQNNGLKVLL